MNKRIYNEDLTLNLIINGSKMKKGNKELLKELYALDSATRKLQLRVAALEMKKRDLARSTTAAGKKTEQYKLKVKTLDAQITSLNKTIQLNDNRMQEMRKEIGLAGLTVNQLNTHLKVLRAQLANATDPVIMKQLRKEIHATQVQLTHLTSGASRLSQAWSNFARKANKYAAAFGYIAGTVFALSMGVQRLIGRLTGLDRRLSEVMKTTELTREEAYQLKKEFDKLKTPTKTDDLLDMAHIAGRLGVRGVENIRDFVSSIDVLNVALGKDLNLPVEEAAEKVGKLVNAFRVDDNLPLHEALLRTGSLLNELDKRSEASSGTILEYLTRLSSLGTTANYSMDKLGGMVAVLNMINIPAERGSTALRKIISGLGAYAEKFSRILGVSVDQYNQMIKEDINAVFLALLKRTSEGDESIVDLVQSMGDLEITGVRVAEVYGGLAQNLDRIVEQQGIATVAFGSSASVMSEFAIMSGDFAAAIDLQGKRVRSLSDFYSKKLQPALFKIYKGFVDFLYLLRDFGAWVDDHAHIVQSLVWLYAALRVKALLGLIKSFSTLSLNLVVGTNNMRKFYQVVRMTNNYGIKGLIAGLRTLRAAMLSNPFTAVATAVMVLVSAMVLLGKRTDEVAKITRKMEGEMQVAVTRSDQVFEKTKQLEKGTKARADGIARIVELYGAYIPKLLDDKSTNEDLAEAQDAVNKSLRETIALKFKNSAFDEEMAKRSEKISKRQRETLSGIGHSQGQDVLAMAMGDFDRSVQETIRSGKDVLEVVDDFINKWDVVEAKREKMIALNPRHALVPWEDTRRELRKHLLGIANDKLDIYRQTADIERQIDSYVTGLNGGSSTPDELDASFLFDAKMDEDTFKQGQKAWKRGYDQQLIAIKESNKSKDEQRRLELNAQLGYYNSLLMLQRAYNDQDLDAMTDLRLKVAETKAAMRQEGIKIDEKNLKDAEKYGIDLEALRIAAIQDSYARELEAEQKNHSDELASFKEKLKDKHITQAEHDQAVVYENQLHANKTNEIHLKYLDVELENDQLNYTERLSLLNTYLETDRITREQYSQRVFDMNRNEVYRRLSLEATSYAESMVLLETAFRNRLISADEYNKAVAEIENDVLALRRKYRLTKDETEEAERKAVMESKAFAALSTEEQEQLLEFIREKYRRKRLQREMEVAQQVADISATGTQMVMNLAEMETAAIEHKVARGIMSEKTGEKKKKQVRKKYADAQFAMAMGEIVSNTALAIIKTWAGYADMPFIGQILAGIQTAMLTGLGATQLAKANQARQSVKQLAKGRYPVMGEDDGRPYDAVGAQRATTGIYTEPTLIAEQPEMVVDYPTLRNIQFNAPELIDGIMAHRITGHVGGYAKKNKAEKAAAPVVHVSPVLKIPLYGDSNSTTSVESLSDAFVKLAKFVDSVQKK